MTQATKILLGLALVLVLGIIGFFGLGYGDRADTTNTATSTDELATAYVGYRVDEDFNKDGTKDAAFIVTQTGDGTGPLYYLAHTLGGEAVLLGDRIEPQSTEWQNGLLVVNYIERVPGELFEADPSIKVTKYFKAEGATLIEVDKAGKATDASSAAGGGAITLTLREQCPNNGGTWSEEFGECTGVNETSCQTMGGTWNECASPCRNNPDAEACILMCVQVCEFK